MNDILIESSKIGKIVISTEEVKSFILKKFDLLVNNIFKIISIEVKKYPNNLVDINILLSKNNKNVKLDDVRNVQNHLSSFVQSNLGIETKSVNVGIEI